MRETIVISGKSGVFVQNSGGNFLLHSHDRDDAVLLEREAFRQLMAGLSDARLIEVESLDDARTLIRVEKEVARATRLFLILLDPAESDEGLEDVADLVDRRVIDAAVWDRVHTAMLAAPLPSYCRLDRLKSFARTRPNLKRLSSSLSELQFSARSVAKMLERVSADHYQTLTQANAFLAAFLGSGLVQRVTAANDAELTKAVEAGIRAAQPRTEVDVVSRLLDEAAVVSLSAKSTDPRISDRREAQVSRAMLASTRGVRTSREWAVPITVPDGVTAKIQADGKLVIAGPKGTLKMHVADDLNLSLADSMITITSSGDTKRARAYWGMQRSLVKNLVEGVTDGFTKKLLTTGAVYRTNGRGRNLKFFVDQARDANTGVSHGFNIQTPDGTKVEITGIDRVQVGRLTAEIRLWRKPEPYLGKRISTRSVIRRSKRKKPRTA